ncbi:MAG: tetratricopeptide repeat protein, partial [Gemmatimonadota bacterium]
MAGLGFLSFKRGDYVTMLRSMRRAVTAEPTNATYRAQLGFANYSFQRPERGIAAMRRALAMDSSLEWVRISLARLYVMDGKLDRARRYVEAMLPTAADSADAFYTLGWVAFMQHDWPEALAYVDRALSVRPEDIDWLADRAAILREMGTDPAEVRRLAAIVADSANARIARG